MRRKRKPKDTPIQKKIKKRLIDKDLDMRDIADWHGHTISNVYIHLARENEWYFTEAIDALLKEYAETGTEG